MMFILPILNNNVVKEDKKKAAIQAMGMAACQAKVSKMWTLFGKQMWKQELI
mgnify:CR=1 FL=1